MSIHTLIGLDAFCDGCQRAFGEAEDEPANAPGVGRWTTSPRMARADMKTYGWTARRIFRGTLDYCPACSQQARTPKPFCKLDEIEHARRLARTQGEK